MEMIKEIILKIQSSYKNHPVFLDLFFLGILSLYVLSGINIVPFHGDETAFIQLSEDYDLVVKQQNIESIVYSLEHKPRQYLRLTTGSILPFFIGFTRDITNTGHPLPKSWRWEISVEENIDKGNMPSWSLLILGRFCSAVMGILGIILFFFTVLQLSSSRLTAWISTFVLATHGDILVNIRRTMQEGPKFLFLILVIYITSHLIKDSQNIKNNKRFYILLGIASGLALAAKQDTAIMLVAVYFALAFIPLFIRWRKNEENIHAGNSLINVPFKPFFINTFYLTLATILAFSIFLLFMPVFWNWWLHAFIILNFIIVFFQLPTWKDENKINQIVSIGMTLFLIISMISIKQWSSLLTPIASMVETRKETINNQLLYYVDRNLFELDTPKNKIIFLLQATVISRPMYMENDSFDISLIHKQIDKYEASILSGRIGSLIFDGFVLILAILGIWSLLNNFTAESFFIFSLLIISGVLLFATIPLPWQRYYLIMQIPYSILIGVGAKQILILKENKY